MTLNLYHLPTEIAIAIVSQCLASDMCHIACSSRLLNSYVEMALPQIVARYLLGDCELFLEFKCFRKAKFRKLALAGFQTTSYWKLLEKSSHHLMMSELTYVLIRAAKAGYHDVAKILTAGGVRITHEYIDCFANSTYDDELSILLTSRAEKFDRELNRLCLHIACGKRFIDAIEILLLENIDVNLGNHEGDTALHLATRAENIPIVKRLLDFGANIDAINRYSETPLHISTSYVGGRSAMTELLIRRGANIEAIDNSGCTALIMAADHGYFEIVKILLQMGARIETKNRKNDTAYLCASKYGYQNILEILLSHGQLIDQGQSSWQALENRLSIRTNQSQQFATQ